MGYTYEVRVSRHVVGHKKSHIPPAPGFGRRIEEYSPHGAVTDETEGTSDDLRRVLEPRSRVFCTFGTGGGAPAEMLRRRGREILFFDHNLQSGGGRLDAVQRLRRWILRA